MTDRRPIVAVLPGDGWYVVHATDDGAAVMWEPTHVTVDDEGDVDWWSVDWSGFAGRCSDSVNFLGAFRASEVADMGELVSYYRDDAARYARRRAEEMAR